MKKIIAGLVVVVAATFYLYFSQFTPAMQIEHNGYVVSDANIEATLVNGEEENNIFPLLQVKELQNVYQRMGSYYIGDEKDILDTTYPLFFNDGTAIAIMNDESTLYDTQFQTIKGTDKTIISDGLLYDKFNVKMDDTVYPFVELKNGLMVNTKPMKIITSSTTYEFSFHTIVYFEKDVVRYMTPKEDKLEYHMFSDLDDHSIVEINGERYRYQDFLKLIGKTSDDTTNTNKKENEKTKNDIQQVKTIKPSTAEGNGTSADRVTIDGSTTDVNGNGANSDNDYDFIEPTVKIADFTTSVYSASSSIKIEDPQKNLEKNRASIEVWANGRIIMRKFYRQSEDITINGLPPETLITFKVKYAYSDKKGIKIEKELGEKTANTKAVSSLGKFSFTYDAGDIYSNQIELKQITMKTSTDEEANANIYRIAVETEKNAFNLSNQDILNLKKGETIKFLSTKSLASRSKFKTSIVVYDKYNNRMNVKDNEIHLTTCKVKPTATLKLMTNKINDTKLLLSMDNDDDVDISSLRMQIYNRSGEMFYDEEIDQEQSEFSFTNFDANEKMTVKIVANYDVEDGKGVLEQQLATTTFTTASLSSLGNISVTTRIPDESILDESISMFMKIATAQTNVDLLSMVGSMKITLSSPSGSQLGDPIQLSEQQLQDIKEGKEIKIDLTSLQSNQRYTFNIHAEVIHGSQTHDYLVGNNMKTFQTLKKMPYYKTRNITSTVDSISFDIALIDKDRSITDDYVSLLATNAKNTVLDSKVIQCSLSEEPDVISWQHYTINKLNMIENPSLWFKVRAKEMNIHHLSSKTKFNEQIGEEFSVALTAEVKGELSQVSVDKSSQDKNLDLKFKGTVSDMQQQIEQGEVFVKAYREGSSTPESSMYMMNMGGESVKEFIDGSLTLEKNHVYTIKMQVIVAGEWKELSSFTIDLKEEIFPIRNIEEYKNVNNNPTQQYLVSAPLDFSQVPADQLESYQIKKLSGAIDFNGFKITFPISDRVRGAVKVNEGTISNVNADVVMVNNKAIVGENNNGELAGAGGLVYENKSKGKIQNVVVHFQGNNQPMLSEEAKANAGVGGIVYKNEGLLDTFVIHVNKGLTAKHQSGYGVAINEGNGIVKNGYVDSTAADPSASILDATYLNTNVLEYETGVSGEGNKELLSENSVNHTKAVGGIVGYNTKNATISNVYSLVGVKNLPNDTTIIDKYDKYIDEDSVGTIVGTNLGKVNNVFGTNEQASYTKTYFGPTVGRNFNPDVSITALNKNTFYLSDTYYDNSKLNERISKLTVNDFEFHQEILNNKDSEHGAFDVNNYIGGGFYPQVKLPASFDLQPLNALPNVDPSDALQVKSIETLSSTDNTAILKVVVNNPGSGDIRSVSMEHIGKVKIVGKQIHENKTTTIQLEISNPTYFLSKYSITKVVAKNNYGSGTVEVSYGSGEKVADVILYRPIHNISDWDNYVVKQGATSYKDSIKENYKLYSDLDFAGEEPTVLDASGKGENHLIVQELSTVLDGNGHKIKNFSINKAIPNIKAPSNPSTQLRTMGLFIDIQGTVKNLTLEKFSGDYLAAGLSQYTNVHKKDVGALIDNVHVVDLDINASNRYFGQTAGLVADARGTTIIQNSSVRNFRLESTNQQDYAYAGLVGYGYDAIQIRNCYAVGLDFNIQTARDKVGHGTAGIISYGTNEIVLENVYSEGKIVSNDMRIGGISSTSVALNITNAISDVDLISTSAELEGISGITNGGARNAPLGVSNALSIGNITRERYVNDPLERLNRIGISTRKGRGYYSADYQQLNGTTSKDLQGADGLLSYEDLKQPETYRTTIGLLDNFEYQNVEKGYLPRLMKTDGSGLVEGQGEGIKLKPNQDHFVKVTGVYLPPNGYGDSVDVQVAFEHSSITEIKDIMVDDAFISAKRFVKQSPTQTSVTFTLRPDLYLDHYTMKQVKIKDLVNGNDENINVDSIIPSIFYKSIDNANEWNKIEEETIAQNYRITKDIDFTNQDPSLVARNLEINRLVGDIQGEDGSVKKAKLKNMKILFDGKTIEKSSANVIQNLYTDMSDIEISNFTLQVKDSWNYQSRFKSYSQIGFINSSCGYIQDVKLSDISINQPTSEDKLAYEYLDILNSSDHRLPGTPLKINGQQVRATYGERVGFISIQTAGYFKNSSVENIEVSGFQSVGALSGIHGLIDNVVVENGHVQGVNYVGGITGRSFEQVPNNVTNIAVKNLNVQGIRSENLSVGNYSNASYTGGIVGIGSSRNNTFKEGSVIGGYVVGGINGNLGGEKNVVENSIITGIDEVGGICGSRSSGYTLFNNIVSNSQIQATGRQYIENGIRKQSGVAGGILGLQSNNALNIYGNLVHNTTVNGTNYAGGICGSITNTITSPIIAFNSVYNTNISISEVGGASGGIFGYAINKLNFDLRDNIVDANITAENGHAGGILGILENSPNSVGSNTAMVSRNMVHGSIQATNGTAAGIIGKTLYPSSNLSRGNITANILDATITDNNPTLNPVFGNSNSTIQSSNTMLSDNFKLNGFTGQQIKDNDVNMASLRPVSNAELKLINTYTNVTGEYANLPNGKWNTSNWDVNTVLENPALYPMLKYNPSSNVATVGANNQYQKESYVTHFPIGASLRVDLKTQELERDTQGLPETTVYTSGIDSINIEFSDVLDNMSYYINDQKDEKTLVKDRVITLSYTYDETMTITLSNGDEEKVIEINPDEYVRKVMNVGSEYYYIDQDVVSNEGKIEGEFIHLYEGKALTQDGMVYDVMTKEMITQVKVSGTQMVCKAIQEFDLDEGHMKTYANFSTINDTTKRDFQMFKNNHSFGIVDGSLDVVKDAIFIDEYQKNEYQYILGQDGVLYALKDRIHTPDNFKNEKIKFMSTSRDSAAHQILLEYEDGSLLGFDYVSGEIIFETDASEQMNFLAYLGEFFDSKSSLIADNTEEIYDNLKEFQLKIKNNPIEQIKNQSQEPNKNKDDTMVSIDETTQFNDIDYVPYYDAIKNEYVLYQVSDLLNQNEKDVMSENDKIAKDSHLQEFYAYEATPIHFASSRSGLILLCSIITAITAGLYYLFKKRNRV